MRIRKVLIGGKLRESCFILIQNMNLIALERRSTAIYRVQMNEHGYRHLLCGGASA
jgi:hypothetical protein